MYSITISGPSRKNVIEKLMTELFNLLNRRRVEMPKRIFDFLVDRQKARCAECGERLILVGAERAHVDHIMPLALGGTSDPRNLQLVHPLCNLRKGARDPLEHAKIMGRLL